MCETRRGFKLLFSVGLGLVSVLGIWFGARSVAGASDIQDAHPSAVSSPAAPTEASLHNPTFDNHDWYFFHDRYDSSYPPGPGGSPRPILPDDDNNPNDDIPLNEVQDWRLWYMRNTPLIQTFAETGIVDAVESVAIRTYEGDIHQAGLYQMIYGATPCLVYEFRMLGRSQPDPGESPYAALRVGIDQVGWHPNTESYPSDPAVPGAFPETTVWGPAHDYKRVFGPLTATAEARADTLAVYAYADARGGRRHAIVWDTGAFQDVTPAMIHDPDNLPAPGGIFALGASPHRDTADIIWATAYEALGQVYYRLKPTGGTAIPDYPIKIFLPIVIGERPLGRWSASPLVKTPKNNHAVVLTGLQPDRTYEYIVVSRGLFGSGCTTWVSDIQTFTTTP